MLRKEKTVTTMRAKIRILGTLAQTRGGLRCFQTGKELHCESRSAAWLADGGMNCHTINMVQKVAVTLDKKNVEDLDRWVREGRYPNRSRALQAAVNLLSDREKRTRLARELSKLDRGEEMRMAEEGLGDASWPAY
jgi:Arc/MetJ-type ribon-helix-helix transcriptional regulator